MSVIGVVRLVGWAVFLVLVLGIVLVLAGANEDNAVVDVILGAGRFLAEPFRDTFDLERGRETAQIAINWGIAAIVYLVLARLLAGLLGMVTRRRKAAR